MAYTCTPTCETEQILKAHWSMTDRTATDGCSCGYKGMDQERHQAKILAEAGLLVRDPCVIPRDQK